MMEQKGVGSRTWWGGQVVGSADDDAGVFWKFVEVGGDGFVDDHASAFVVV